MPVMGLHLPFSSFLIEVTLLRQMKVHYRYQSSLPVVRFLIQIYPAHTL
jgi:hypothetical protein